MPGIEHVPIRWAQPTWITSMKGKMQPVLIVDHIMQGYLQTMVDWASNGGSKVITHFAVGRTGRKVQFQDVFTPGIHATSLNKATARRALERAHLGFGVSYYSIGIEHEGCSVPPVGYTVPAELIYSPTNRWPAAMVAASLDIKRWCFANVPSLGAPSRDSIIGHYEVDNVSRANDPESPSDRAAGVWPVEQFIAALKDATPDVYVVQRGDSLSEIATRFSISLTDLSAWNGVSDPNVIQVGATLRLSATAVLPAAPDEEPPTPSTPSTDTSPSRPFQPPRVDIAIVVDGERLTLPDGEYGGFSEGDNQDIYRRPVDFGSLGKGWVVVGVTRPPGAK